MELCIVFPCCFIEAFPEVLQFLTFSNIHHRHFHYCRMYRGVVPEELMVCGISLSLSFNTSIFHWFQLATSMCNHGFGHVWKFPKGVLTPLQLFYVHICAHKD